MAETSVSLAELWKMAELVVTKENLSTVIRQILRTSDFKLADYETQAATAEVSGFLATHRRVTATVEHNGKTKQLRFFVKCFPLQESQKEIVKKMGAFRTEVGFYSEILPEMERLGVEMPYPRSFLARSDDVNDFLILEDLAVSGYGLRNRMQGLDVQHCSLVLKELAKLHAASVALEKNKGKPLNEVYPFLQEAFFNHEEFWINYFGNCVKTTLTLTKLLPRYKDSVADLQEKMSGLYDTACELVKPWDVVNVTCHGDLWVNNVLFKYKNDKQGEAPLAVKLLDLQLGRYGPPTLDLILFLYVSTRRSLRDKHLNTLLRDYHSSFSDTLSALGMKLPQFTFDALKKDFSSKQLLGIAYSILYFPIMLMDEEDAKELMNPDTPDEFQKYMVESQESVACENFLKNNQYRLRFTELIDELFSVLR